MKKRILLIDDDVDLQKLVAEGLRREKFVVVSAQTGEEGLRLAYDQHPDLIILDLMLPGIGGLEVCRRIC